MTIREDQLTGVERRFDPDQFIVSKTDPKGRITYANRLFLQMAGYTEKEILGQPHNIIRHPHMPRCVFKLLWERIQAGAEIFGYILNAAKGGDHYWVLAHVTPSFDADNRIVGYHSNRRQPTPRQIATIQPIYEMLRAEEQRHADRRAGMERAFAMFQDFLQKKSTTYDAFVLSI